MLNEKLVRELIEKQQIEELFRMIGNMPTEDFKELINVDDLANKITDVVCSNRELVNKIHEEKGFVSLADRDRARLNNDKKD